MTKHFITAETPGEKRLIRLVRRERKRDKEQIDEILARPDARGSTGLLNPRVVSIEEARLISQQHIEAIPPEEQARQQEPITPPLQQALGAAARAAPSLIRGALPGPAAEAVIERGPRALELVRRPEQAVGAVVGPLITPALRATGFPKPLAETIGGRQEGQAVLDLGQRLLSGEITPRDFAGQLIAIQESKPILQQLLSELPAALIPPIGAVQKGGAALRTVEKLAADAIKQKIIPAARRFLTEEAGVVRLSRVRASEVAQDVQTAITKTMREAGDEIEDIIPAIRAEQVRLEAEMGARSDLQRSLRLPKAGKEAIQRSRPFPKMDIAELRQRWELYEEFLQDPIPKISELFEQQRTLTLPQRGAIQSGMDIGERPAQGSLLEGFTGEGGAVPLANREALLARQASREAIAKGQQELPLEAPIPTVNPRTGLTPASVPGGQRATPLEPRPRPIAEPRPDVPEGTRLPSGREPGGLGRAVPPPPRDPHEMLLAALEPEGEPLISKLRSEIPQQVYDRNFPLKELEKATGVPARQSAQVVPGAASAGEDIVRRFYAPIVKPVEKDVKFLERFMVLARGSDILARNPRARLPGGIANEGERQIALATLAKEVGPERFAAIENAATELWRLNDEQVLRPWLDEGIISTEMYREMRATHPHYIPFQRADFTEIITQSFSARPEANLSTTGIKTMGIEGSERALANPLQRLLQEPIKAKIVVFRNRAAKSIVRALEALQRQTGEELVRYIDPKRPMGTVTRVTGEVIPRLKKGEISQQFDTISFFENGVKNRVEVPAIYARVAKGLEAEPDNIALKIARTINAPLRYGATTFNPFFLPVNVLRDAMSAMFREKLFPFGPDYIAGLWAAIRKNALFSEASQAGTLLAGVTENMNPARAIKNPLGGIKVRNPWDAVTLPFRLVEEANLIAERGIRIGTFRKLKAEGLDDLTAAVRSRDATVDFAKSGHAIRVLNQIIPFTNAAVQGSANIARTIRDHPVRSLAFGSMFATGTIMARVNNMRFETSGLIPDYEYTRNYVVQFGEGTRDDGTKFPIYVKIPKGEIAAMFTFPAEALFNLARITEDRGAIELLLDSGFEAVRTVSPIELGGVTGLLPPLAETGVGLQTGIDPFTNIPIVPRREQNLPPEQQFGPETSATAVSLGNLFNVSPRMIDFAINDIAAGTGQTVNWLLSMGLEALGMEPAPFGEEAPDGQAVPTGAERLREVPGVSRFVNTRSTQLARRGFANLDEAVVATNRAFSKLPDVNRLGIRFGTVGSRIGQVDLTPQQRAQYQDLAGEEAVRLAKLVIDAPSYTALSDRVKEKRIRDAINAARERTRNRLLREIRAEERGGAPTDGTAPITGQPRQITLVRRETPTPEPVGVR